MIPDPAGPSRRAHPEETSMRIGVLRGRENSFPEAFIAKVNSMGKGVAAEYVQLGGTKLNEHVPYRVILDRMSHEVPYYAVYLKMAALAGTYCINNVFWRSADDKFFGYAAAEKLGIHEPRTVVLPNREYVDDVTADSLRNLWPTDFNMYLEYVGTPCIMKPAFGGGWKDVHKIHSLEELHFHRDNSGQKTMMLQEFIVWDTYIRVPTVGRRWARAIRYDPAPGGMGGYNQDYDSLPRAFRDQAEELSLLFNQALGYDMNALEFAVKDGRFYGIDLTNYTPDFDYRSLKDAHFPWVVEKMAEFAVEKALSDEPTPTPPSFRELMLR
jgi:glutathione synthase/RimK-type ligase-like ATP-grasp enzyme